MSTYRIAAFPVGWECGCARLLQICIKVQHHTFSLSTHLHSLLGGISNGGCAHSLVTLPLHTELQAQGVWGRASLRDGLS